MRRSAFCSQRTMTSSWVSSHRNRRLVASYPAQSNLKRRISICWRGRTRRSNRSSSVTRQSSIRRCWIGRASETRTTRTSKVVLMTAIPNLQPACQASPAARISKSTSPRSSDKLSDQYSVNSRNQFWADSQHTLLPSITVKYYNSHIPLNVVLLNKLVHFLDWI